MRDEFFFLVRAKKKKEKKRAFDTRSFTYI